MIDKNPPLKKISIEKLEFWEEANVRKTDPYKDLDELTNNIKKIGIKNPLLAKGKNNEGKYLVFSGQRRLMSCTEAGLKEIPCFVHEKITLIEASLLSLSENLYRLKMNYNDIADAAKKLISHYGDRKLVAKALGVTENTVKRYLRYDDVPKQIKALVGQKKISAHQAMDLYSKFPDQDKSIRIARELSRFTSRPQKKKFYYAAKRAKPGDTVNKIRKQAKKMKPFRKYVIEVPPVESNIIQRLARRKNQKPEETIVEMIEIAINAYNQGIIDL